MIIAEALGPGVYGKKEGNGTVGGIYIQSWKNWTFTMGI